MSSTYWLVAKHMADMRRREPRNYGVILVRDERVGHRFRGQREDGAIDGRSVRRDIDLAVYRSWIEYWLHALEESSDPDDVRSELLTTDPDQSIFLEFGGRVLADTDSESDFAELLNDLYSTLVEEAAPRGADDPIADISKRLVEGLELGTDLQRDFRLQTKVKERLDTVIFDYRFDNGRPHLMKNVPMPPNPTQAWTTVHAATWSFERAYAEGFTSLIALMKLRAEDHDLEEQANLIEGYASVVDVTDPKADRTLRELLLAQ